MKSLVVLSLLSVGPLLFAPAPQAAQLSPGAAGRVALETAPLRAAPRFFSPALATLKAGDAVTVVRAEGAWYEVTAGQVKGFIHSSALYSEASYRLDAGQMGSGQVTYAERTAAARGFTPAVEAEHRRSRPETASGYAAVDRLEAFLVDQEGVAGFMREGGVTR